MARHTAADSRLPPYLLLARNGYDNMTHATENRQLSAPKVVIPRGAI